MQSLRVGAVNPWTSAAFVDLNNTALNLFAPSLLGIGVYFRVETFQDRVRECGPLPNWEFQHFMKELCSPSRHENSLSLFRARRPYRPT